MFPVACAGRNDVLRNDWITTQRPSFISKSAGRCEPHCGGLPINLLELLLGPACYRKSAAGILLHPLDYGWAARRFTNGPQHYLAFSGQASNRPRDQIQKL